MNCKICGYEFSDETEICPECGAPIASEEAETTGEAEAIENNTTNEFPEEITDDADISSLPEEIDEDSEPSSDNADDEFSDFADEEYDEQDFQETRKAPMAFKITTLAIALVVVIIACAAAYYQFFVPGNDNPVLSFFGFNVGMQEAQPMIYTKQEEGKYNIYIKSENTKEILLKSADSANSQFTKYSDFVLGGKNLFYLNDKSLYAYTLGENEPVKITDNVLVGSMVISADHNTVLFIQKVGDNSSMDLYKFKKGSKNIEKIDTLPSIKQKDQYPTYGFLEETNDIWFLKVEEGNSNGELFVKVANKDAKSVLTDATYLIAGIDGGNTLVYTSTQDVNATLYLKEKGKEAVVLTENYNNSKPVIVKSPYKGIYYIGELTGDSETGQASGILYYQKFGGDKVQIDTQVSALVKQSMMSSMINPAYDYARSPLSDESIAYLKENEILISKNGKSGSLPEGMNFSQSNPIFAKDGESVGFISDGTLKHSRFKDGAWSAPESVAENVAGFTINDDGSSIAYFIRDESDQAKATLNLYSTKTKQTQKMTDSAISECYFDKTGKTLYFTSDYNQEKGSAVLSYYTDGKKIQVLDSEINGFIVSESYVPYIVKVSDMSATEMEIYTITKDMKIQLISQGIININNY